MSLETVSNGGPHAQNNKSLCEKGGHSSDENHTYGGGGASRRISAVRKTLAGWLRLDRSTSTQQPTSSNHKIAQRSKSIENVRLTSDGGHQNQDDASGRSRNEERRGLSWGNWRRRMTSRSVLPNHNRPPSDTHHTETSFSKSPQFGNSSVTKRALPPVPSPVPVSHQAENVIRDGIAESPDPQDEDGHGLHGLAAYIEDRPEFDEDEGALSSQPVKGSLIDFAASIEKVKSYGWYWGPISREASERLLEPEPDGSFIVRDSSADHYIFSLTFKLNGNVSHVRIEHDQGNFSFGSLTKFKSNTIVDFIENAVEHSRSGRYLFFLHRRPERGPMRVQLLNPVSRLKQIRSLQHMCRFVILALVPRDLLHQLPVPKRIRTYLDTPFYYSETIADWTVPGNEPVSSNLSNNEGNETEVGNTSPLPSITSSREENPSSQPVLQEQEVESSDANQTYQSEFSTNNGNRIDASEMFSNLATSYTQNTVHNNIESIVEDNSNFFQSPNSSQVLPSSSQTSEIEVPTNLNEVSNSENQTCDASASNMSSSNSRIQQDRINEP